MDLLDQGQGRPIGGDVQEEHADDLFRVGKDADGNTGLILNQSFITKLLSEPHQSLNSLVY